MGLANGEQSTPAWAAAHVPPGLGPIVVQCIGCTVHGRLHTLMSVPVGFNSTNGLGLSGGRLFASGLLKVVLFGGNSPVVLGLAVIVKQGRALQFSLWHQLSEEANYVRLGKHSLITN